MPYGLLGDPAPVPLIDQAYGYDTDAASYIRKVESADRAPLELAVRVAINEFVRGCKADGIWSAIKASCILAGARTLNGALVPLVGTAPTNFNFVSGDYNRKTGLVGNASTKYLDSNWRNNADPQNSKHLAVWASSAGTNNETWNTYIGALPNDGTGRSDIELISPGTSINFYANTASNVALVRTRSGALGLYAVSRSNASQVNARIGGVTTSGTAASTTPWNGNIYVFARNLNNGTLFRQYINARLAFYSIGESLNLALFDARLTDLINAFAIAIP